MMLKIISRLLFLLLLISCHKEGLVDEPLQHYLQLFSEEASRRGIVVNYKNRPVEARLELHDDSARLGWCNYHDDQPDQIIINTFYWSILDDFEKEKLVFHELGHCILNRAHLDEVRSDGHCKSIMQSGQRCADNYSAETRDQYLDELFLRR